VVAAEPPGSVTAGNGFGLVVVAEDSSGNVDPSFNGSVTASVGINPGGTSLGGATTVTAVAGVATFTGLTLDIAAAGYTVNLSGGGLVAASTSPIAVGAGPATQLILSSQPPGTVNADSPFNLVVTAEDRFGNVDPTYSGSVALAATNNPAATVSGPLAVTASQGVARFSGLSLNQTGNNAEIQASSGGLSATTSGPIGVIPHAARVMHALTAHTGKKKGLNSIVIQFQNATLNPLDAQSLSNYVLTTISTSRRVKAKALALASATYDAATNTLTLVTKKPFVLKPPLQLRIVASGVLDAYGRQLDGKGTGQPGSGDYVATVSGAGVTPSTVGNGSVAAPKTVAASAIDSLMATGFRPANKRLKP
jgi:hypothetical protein